MAMSEDHTSCWGHKDLVVTREQVKALITAAMTSGGLLRLLHLLATIVLIKSGAK